ncbi:MAG TPA: hypothetical protein IAC04_08455 [Candidatus Coprenecus stercoravium]|uniref:Uncharacterized protein n=1 Tax=Candidatus Coprenecus stercoravium TaxID=2840735 RepID=A0A9D2K9H1_9BACT|nr:hypothetical protein [Candidatus Coprenecus stercoravium]
MERFITLNHSQNCMVIGGASTAEGRVARMLGRLVGAVLKAVYDTLTRYVRPQVKTAS